MTALVFRPEQWCPFSRVDGHRAGRILFDMKQDYCVIANNLVALYGEVQTQEDKLGALHREILGEAWCQS